MLQKNTQFTYKTLKARKCFELFTGSRCCKLNSFTRFHWVEKLAICHKYVCKGTLFLFLPRCAAWNEAHLTLKCLHGEWQDGRDACRDHFFHLGLVNRNVGNVDREKGNIFCTVIPHLCPQIDALAALSQRRCSKCT